MTTETAEATHLDEDTTIEGLAPAPTPDTALVLRSRNGEGVLSIDPHQKEWTPPQVVGLRSIGVETEGPDAVPDAYVWQFLHMVQKMDLDPWMREAYLITHGKRYVNNQGAQVDNRKFTLVTGIDGFRKKAEDTHQYAGQVGPQWCGEDGVWKEFWSPKWGAPTAARVGILRRGFTEPVWGVAMYDEFVPMVDEYVEVTDQNGRLQWENGRPKRKKTGNKVPTEMWQKMGANQIAKCAEAQGHRKAFPRTMAGMYEAAEMQRAQAEYQQQQEDERERQITATRTAAYAAATGKPVEPETVGTIAAEVVAGTPGDESARSTAPSDTPVDEVSPDEIREGWVRELDALGVLLERPARTLVERKAAAFNVVLPDDTEDTDALVAGFSIDQLATVVVALRPYGIEALRKSGEDDMGDEYARVADEQAKVRRAVPVDVEALSGPDPTSPHEYADKGGLCRWCGEEEPHKLHPVDADAK